MDGRGRLSGTNSLVVNTLNFRVESTGFEPRGGTCLRWISANFCTEVHQGTVMSTRKEWFPPGKKHQWGDEMRDSEVDCNTLALIWHVSMHFEINIRLWHKAMRYAIPASMPTARWPPLIIPPRISLPRDPSPALPEAYISLSPLQVTLLTAVSPSLNEFEYEL